jgi:hypothetical protein
MAAALSALMAENERVMWVGGMAHWTRIVARLADNECALPLLRSTA